MLRFDFMLINVLFQNFSLVFRIAYYIHSRNSLHYIHFVRAFVSLTALFYIFQTLVYAVLSLDNHNCISRFNP